jgi:hypothetical protein
MRLPFPPLSTEIMLRKEILTVERKIYAIVCNRETREKLLKENTGSDKGKLVPTDIRDNRY